MESRKHLYIFTLIFITHEKVVPAINLSKLFSKPAGSVTLHLNTHRVGHDTELKEKTIGNTILLLYIQLAMLPTQETAFP